MKQLFASHRPELERFLRRAVGPVPARTKGREKEDCEWWLICRLLSTLSSNCMLTFPLRLTKRESPDFEIDFGQTAWGIEVTEAIIEDEARADALAEKENLNAIIDPSLFRFGEKKDLDEIREIINQEKLTGEGWSGSQERIEVAQAIQSVIISKTRKLRNQHFDKYPLNCLLIYENISFDDFTLIAEHSVRLLKDYWSQGLIFDVIYIESGDSIFLFASGGIQKFKIKDV